eukprot:snap_masked-scaffold_1-processed-gene-30.47-mRNA-1 protein AED:0.01 eAED:0.01 QI:0/-1/0/1/-1/1/1/0/371
MVQDAHNLRKQLRELKSKLETGRFETTASHQTGLGEKIAHRKTLEGHFSKVYALHWGKKGSEGAADKLVSCSQDGKILVWDAPSKNKTNVLTPKTPYTMTCAFEQSESGVVCAGGLDNAVSLYTLSDNVEIRPTSQTSAVLQGHEGYISCARFLERGKLVSSSGDTTCMYFDVESGKPLHYFKEHRGDVMSVCPRPGQPAEFISGSVDTEVKLWDVRVRASQGAAASIKGDVSFSESPGTPCASQMVYVNNESDVNSVMFMSNGYTFGTGSDDASCRIFDIRCHQEINVKSHNTMVISVTSIEFSKSGRLLFAAYEDGNIYGWDSIIDQTDMDEEALKFKKEQEKVSFLATQTEGKCLAVSTWDPPIKLYA